MRTYDISSSALTKQSLARLEVLIKERVVAKPATDTDVVQEADREYVQALGLWFERQSSRYFTREEIKLQCVVALRYADPARPTVRELWQYLQVLIEQDALSLPGRRKMRFPSYSTFYSRIENLPRRLVWKTRKSRDKGRVSIASVVIRFEAATSEVH
ncbi:hypothetical protein [Rhizobium sp. 11515TR]|uniref:hypothetical protein n=1 Tax=Rhizobium sp. 11515TR TaxID=2028343 RepID=UPI0011B638B2|nr:hypothetical protein [Rhizobium sp. 11515TR]